MQIVLAVQVDSFVDFRLDWPIWTVLDDVRVPDPNGIVGATLVVHDLAHAYAVIIDDIVEILFDDAFLVNRACVADESR
jgi:hypothetical protein